MDLLSRSLEETHHKASKSVVKQLREENSHAAPKEPLVSAPFKGLHLRTDSESNRFANFLQFLLIFIFVRSASYFSPAMKSIITKPTKPKPGKLSSTSNSKPGPKDKKEKAEKKPAELYPISDENKSDVVNMSMDMSLEYSPEKITDTNTANSQRNEDSDSFVPNNDNQSNKRKERNSSKAQSSLSETSEEKSENSEKKDQQDASPSSEEQVHAGNRHLYICFFFFFDFFL
jgi:hypothetical protein